MLKDDFLMLELLLDGESMFKLSRHYLDKKKGKRKFLRKWLKGHAHATSNERLSVLIHGKFLNKETDNLLVKYWTWMLDFYRDMINTITEHAGDSDYERIKGYARILECDCGIVVKPSSDANEEPKATLTENIFFLPSKDSFLDENIPSGTSCKLYFQHFSKDAFDEAIAILQDYGFSIVDKSSNNLASTITIESAFHCPNVELVENKLTN